MLDKVKELINRPHVYEITFKYETYGDVIVTCTVKRPYIKHLAVYGIANTDEQALANALILLDKVKALEEKVKILQPDLDKQKHVNGYYRETVFENYEVSFRRTPDSYVITDVRQKEDGFYLAESDYPLPKTWLKMGKNELYGVNIEQYRALLKEGEELYYWDNIRHLSGSAGIAIVKNGNVIKTKGIAIS
jgi:hypothetical protein